MFVDMWPIGHSVATPICPADWTAPVMEEEEMLLPLLEASRQGMAPLDTVTSVSRAMSHFPLCSVIVAWMVSRK